MHSGVYRDRDTHRVSCEARSGKTRRTVIENADVDRMYSILNNVCLSLGKQSVDDPTHHSFGSGDHTLRSCDDFSCHTHRL